MGCRETQAQLQGLLDGDEALLRAELYAHLSRCAPCRSLYDASQRLCRGVSQLRPIAPPAGLAARITQAILARQQSSNRRRLLVAATLAATVLVGSAAATFWGILKLRPSETGLVQSRAPANPAKPGLSAHGSRMDPIGPSPLPAVMLDWRGMIEPPARSLAGAGQSVADGLGPVADTARRAVDVLLQDGAVAHPGTKGG